MRVVFDTNVLVSALIKTGKPRELFSLAADGRVQLVLSKSLLEELIVTIDEPRIRKYADKGTIDIFLNVLSSSSKIVRVKSKFNVVKEDPDDDAVLGTAFDGKAEYIVSGDKHLLALGEFKGIKIVNITEMLSVVKNP